MAQQTESQLHEAVCNYIRLQYPNVLFNSDMSGIKLTMGQAIKAKKLRSNSGFPDLIIYKSRLSCFNTAGLCVELKKDGTKIYKKNGDYATDHIKKQNEILLRLQKCSFEVHFAIGFSDAKRIIDNYLKL